MFGAVGTKPGAEYGVPPVSFRLSWYGRATEKGGKFVAADVVESSLDGVFDPAAMAAEMEGLPVVTKLPHIAIDRVRAKKVKGQREIGA